MACCKLQKLPIIVIGVGGGVATFLFTFLLFLGPTVSPEQSILLSWQTAVSTVSPPKQDADESAGARMTKNRAAILEGDRGGSASGQGEGRNRHEEDREGPPLSETRAAMRDGRGEGARAVTDEGGAQKRGSRHCKTGWLYVYDMPERFNKEIVETCNWNRTRWLCNDLQNQGLGVPMAEAVDEEDADALRKTFGDLSLWYKTGSYIQEVTYHARMLQHPCRTHDPEKASAFYIPYYVNLGVERDTRTGNRTLWKDLASAAIDWLAKQPYVTRHGGYDHFFVIGHISYAFTSVGAWGNNLLLWPFFANMTKLPFERDVWEATMASVPYPTPFHPSRDEQIQHWIQKVRSAERRNVATFVGSRQRLEQVGPGRKNFEFRNSLMDQCEEWDQCSLVDCKETGFGLNHSWICHSPFELLQQYMVSEFCLQPKGDSPSRKGIFDSMLAGCIPVFFASNSAYAQYLWYLPVEWETYSVFIKMDDVAAGKTTFKEALSKYTPEQKAAMREVILDKIVPHIIVANPMSYQLQEARDAVDIAVEGMMTKVARLKAGLTHTFPDQYLIDTDPWTAHERLEQPPSP